MSTVRHTALVAHSSICRETPFVRSTICSPLKMLPATLHIVCAWPLIMRQMFSMSSALWTLHFAHSSSELYSPTLLLFQNGMLTHMYRMDLKVAFLVHAWASLSVTAQLSARFGDEAYDAEGLLRKEGPLSSLYEDIVCIQKCYL